MYSFKSLQTQCLFTEEIVVNTLEPLWPFCDTCAMPKDGSLRDYCFPPLSSFCVERGQGWGKGGALARCPLCWRTGLCQRAGHQLLWGQISPRGQKKNQARPLASQFAFWAVPEARQQRTMLCSKFTGSFVIWLL